MTVSVEMLVVEGPAAVPLAGVNPGVELDAIEADMTG